MALKDIIPMTATVKYQDTDINVTGLSLESLTALVQEHWGEMQGLMEGQQSVAALAATAPIVAAKIIAYAAGEPEQVEAARGLPFGVQLEILEKVWDFSVPNEESLGKMIDRVTAGMKFLDAEAGVVAETGKK